MNNEIKQIVHVVTASYSLDEVPDPEEMDAKLEGIAGRAPDARGVAITTHQRDISWDCNSEEAALSLSERLREILNVTVEIIEIED